MVKMLKVETVNIDGERGLTLTSFRFLYACPHCHNSVQVSLDRLDLNLTAYDSFELREAILKVLKLEKYAYTTHKANAPTMP